MTLATDSPKTPTERNLALYNREAARLASGYDTITTPQALPKFCTYVRALADKENARVLDLGCGSGRDALWMAQQGLGVTAVDGSSEMLAIARAGKAHALIDYVHDEAPALAQLSARNECFDAVLANAFLFHFDAAGRAAILDKIKAMIKPAGFAYLTLRHGPAPAGGAIYEVAVAELEDWAAHNNAQVQQEPRAADALGRGEITWDHVVIAF